MVWVRAVARTTIAVIIVAALIAFSAGFIAKPPSTITVRETIPITALQTVTQTLLTERTVVQTQVRTIPTTIIETATLANTITSTIYSTITRIETVRQMETVVQTSTVTRVSTIVSTVTQAMGLPEGATPLPFTGRTVFALISTGFNFNGSSGGSLIIYIPTGWGIEITYTNSHTIPHSIVIVRNNTATPQSSNIANDGTVIASQPEQYTSGITQGSTVRLALNSIPEGIYWIACGVPGHAQAGMWIILASSPNVSIPYAITTQPSGGGSGYQYSYNHITTLLISMASLLLIPIVAALILRSKGG
ncbi:MAG TPA: sulfocyanin-like copper-binding protein [Sulfolobales archaeon]|nr:sulfocyanin-like copper-binding protein [Sulfolobales archaeon]